MVFHDEPVDGVIHVVANGHATPRRTAGTTGRASATREELLAVVDYYSPGSGSPFGDKIDELRALAGGAKLSVDVLPVSSRGGDRKSALSAKQASAMVDALATRLAQLSGHV
ncbi:hypothetical protein [Nocardioides sp. B-3]|uniref:hypothetical protein n=1 Tax=Nocardioides sp. B-3 TaxID=2895565 RepID=UPI0021524B53|nr:hypothetical protein [Nocardioides sp. B-3]UUZ61156.1 hypothetical protein LP418_11345 [Nocardioides sp. B-3]